MKYRLDRWDRQIVDILRQDGRTANVQIARQLGLSEATVRKRIERLITAGVIHVVALTDPERVGLTARMIIAMQVDQSQLDDLAERLAALPEVCSLSIVTGTYDLIAEVALPSTASLLSFMLDRLVTMPGVKRTDTYHVLKVKKRFCDWVIPEAAASHNGPAQRQPASRKTGSDVMPGAIVVPT